MRLACCGSTPIGADLGGDARRQARQRRAGGIQRLRGQKLRQMLKKRVNGYAQRARKQTALVALVEAVRT